MKKIVYLFALVAIALTSCNPLEDINNEIDAIPVAPNVGVFDYTLTEDDYATLEVNGSFANQDEAKALIPQILDAQYPLYGQGSTVNVTYQLFVGDAEGVSDFISSDIYQFTNDDYAATGSDAFGFYPNVDASDEIPAVLATQITGATDGQLLLVEYDQYFETPTVGIADLFSAEFPADYDSFERVTIVNPDTDSFGWLPTSSNVTGNGFDSSIFDQLTVEEWLISPQIDLSGESDVLFEITQEIDFLGDESLIDILVSTDYAADGDVASATWTAVSFDKTAFGSLSSTGDLDFSDYDGQQVYIALKYSSIGEEEDPAPSTGDASRWRVQSFAVKAVGVSGETNGKGEYFVFDGTEWELADDVYYLSDADYDSMGEESGQPGRFNNFSSSVAPENYLPQFLSINYPFAQEEDEIFIIYKFFSGGVSRQGNLYTFTNGEWVGDTDIITTSLQFGFDNGMWVPDNTIRYELVQADYDLVVAELTGNPDFEAAVGNLDSFGNFNRTGGSTSWSDDMMLTALSIVLDNLNPGAEDGQKYIALAEIWAPGNEIEEFALIKEGGAWVYQ